SDQRTLISIAWLSMRVHVLLELEALELARGGTGQLGDDPDLARPLVAREEPLGVPHQLDLERGRVDGRVPWHDEDEGLDEPRGLRAAAPSRREDAGMLHQHRLDVSRHDPLPRHLEEVVLAPAMGEKAVGVADVDVARAEPVADESPARVIEALPVPGR